MTDNERHAGRYHWGEVHRPVDNLDRRLIFYFWVDYVPAWSIDV